MDLDMTHSLCVPNMPVVTPDFELNHMQVGAILYLGMLAQATLPNKRPSHAQEIAAGAAGPLLPESGTRKRTVNGEKRPEADANAARNPRAKCSSLCESGDQRQRS
jgi:hypothetical protein